MQTDILEATGNPEDLVIQAARNDYSTEYVASKDTGQLIEESGSEDREEFVERLLERGHYGPFEHPQITVAMEGISRVCMAQITRHRHATFDVQSLRYTAPGADVKLQTPEDVEEYIVVPSEIRDNVENDGADSIEHFLRQCLWSYRNYQYMVEGGVPKEDARFVLPMATKVNIVMSMNARHLLHILDMRHAADAQWEAQELAEQLLGHIEVWMPITASYYLEEMDKRKNRLAP